MFRRCFHHSRSLLNEETVAMASRLGKGKKIPPAKQKLVILNAAQSRLVREVPKYFQDEKRKRDERRQRLSNNSYIEEQRSKLIAHNSKVTNEQTVTRLDQIKSNRKQVSKKRYEQIVKEVSMTCTIAQLRDYIASEYPLVRGYKPQTKVKLITKIMNDCWRLRISEDINADDDLVLQREFDLSPRELYLLLLQRTFDQWIRANVKIIILPEELRVIVRANKSHLQYIELALEKILKNIGISEIELGSIVDYLKENGRDLPIDQIQNLSAVFFQENKDGNPNEYKMYALGSKKFSEARRLILWSLENNPFVKDLIITNSEVLKNTSDARYFQYFQTDSLPWLYQDRPLHRFQSPKTKDFVPRPIQIDTESVYRDLNADVTKSLPIPSGTSTQEVTAVVFGQVLHELDTDSQPKNSILNTHIPSIKNKMRSLPLFQHEEPEDQLMDSSLDTSADYHTYFAQIKYMASPYKSDIGEDGSKNRVTTDIKEFFDHPPIEFWVEIDEHNKAKFDTLQVVMIEKELNSTVLLPDYSTDLKFTKSNSVFLVSPDGSSGGDDWLADQPGIKHHLSTAKLNFGGRERVNVPNFVDVNLPGFEEPVRYAYVSLSYRRHLNCKLNDKLLQFAVIEGGSFGGRTMELILVGDEKETIKGDNSAVDEVAEKEKMKELVEEAAKFVEELEQTRIENRTTTEEEENHHETEITQQQ